MRPFSFSDAILLTPFLVSVMIASGRAPFDLAEAESELVAGSTTELAGVGFTLVLLVDYVEFLFGFAVLCSFGYLGIS